MNIPLGWLIALGCGFAGFIWLGGHAQLLWVPQEYLVIFGTALGTLIACNKFRNLKNLSFAIAHIFTSRGHDKQANLEVLCLMFELLQKMKKQGALALEADIDNPQSSSIFSKYRSILADHRMLEFITDYFRMMLDGSMSLGQLESVMAQEIEVMHEEMMEPARSMATMADSLPAFGIVAAIIGVIHTLSNISAGMAPGEVGSSIGSALVGTLLGVFSSYAVFSPIAKTLEQRADEDLRPYEAIQEILIANFSQFSPLTAVEYGRKVLYSDQRPSMLELESGVQDMTGVSMRG